jgi:TetR/AcrR family transcriptional repressor for divergent bdcA
MTARKTAAVRGRPRGFDLDEAVELAMKLFHRSGYDAVGVAELGVALGVTPPSFYAAFGSKLGLFRQALERYSTSNANLFAVARTEGGSVIAVVDRLLHLAARCYPERDGIAGCLVIDGARNTADRQARALTLAAKAANNTALREFIASKYPERADELADFVSIAMAGMSSAARDGADEATLTAFADAASRTFRREATARARRP